MQANVAVLTAAGSKGLPTGWQQLNMAPVPSLALPAMTSVGMAQLR